MKTFYKNLFYGTIAASEYPPKGEKLKKTGLPIQRLTREIPYLLGEGRGNKGKLQIYFSLLPEFAGRTFFGKKPRSWKPEAAERLLHDAGERAYVNADCAEQIIAADLKQYKEEIPIELWAAWLYHQRPFDSICVSLDEESGQKELQQLTDLIAPYLPRMRRIACRGPRGQCAEMLEKYLYEEFGIVMTDAEKISGVLPAFDLNGFESRLKTLKFLDTVVKNGYNTKVD